MKVKLEREGFWVCRAAGSHGVADLVAIAPSTGVFGTRQIRFVSCKIPEKAPKQELEKLIAVAKKYGATPYLTVKEKGEWVLKAVT